MNLEYLFGADFRCCGNDGEALTGGYIEVYIEGETSTPYITYCDFNGSCNPAKIPIPANGMPVIIVDTANKYRVHCYNDLGGQVWSRYNVTASAHIPGKKKLVIDEDDFTLTEMGDCVILSLNK